MLDLPEIQWRRMSPRYITLEVVSYLLWLLVFVVVTVGLAIAVPRFPAWLFPLPIVVILAINVFLVVPRVRVIGYALREDDLLFRRGLIWSRLVAVPYGRMQLVDVRRGPVERMLGLASLRLVTAAASTAVVVPGIPSDDADRLRDHLVAVAESRRAGI